MFGFAGKPQSFRSKPHEKSTCSMLNAYSLEFNSKTGDLETVMRTKNRAAKSQEKMTWSQRPIVNFTLTFW